MSLRLDPRAIEERQREIVALRRVRCPHSGLPLTDHGEGCEGSMSCAVCDCFGFPAVQV